MSHGEIRLSEEQEKMISAALAGKNVLVDACVGSGKTTAIQRLCDVLPGEKSILYLTYNRLLRRDAEGKIQNKNATVTNYHGFASSALKKCKVPCGVSELIDVFLKVKPPIAHYDVLILDEYQDIDEEISRLLFAIQEVNPEIQIVAVGDMQQKIYDRTRLNVPEFLDRFMGERVSITFTQCFRLSKEHAEFLAGCWKKTIAGVNDACTVEHWSMEEIVEYLRRESPKDILCLGNRNGLMTECLNRLETLEPERFNKNTVYASIRDEDNQQRLDTANAAIFTTYDSSKGLERKIAVVFDFDVEYWRGRLRKSNTVQEILRNVFLVAASRGKEKIIFAKQGYVPLGKDDFYGTPPLQEKRFDVSGMFDFKYRENVEECFSLLEVSKLRSAGDVISIQSHDGLIDISPCIGIYQEAVFFQNYDIDRQIQIWRSWERVSDASPAPDASLDEKILYLTAKETRMKRYQTQVRTPFVSEAEKDTILRRLSTVFDGKENVQLARMIRLNDYFVMGICDAVSGDTVYELKFVSELAHEHYLQCAMYMLALNLPHGRLWNVKNDEMVEITVPDKQRFLDCVVKAVSKEKQAVCQRFTTCEYFCSETPIPSIRQTHSERHIAVIDTETNRNDEVMSIGVVMAEAETFTPLERKYYVFPKESLVGGMYSHALYMVRDIPVQTCEREEAIAEIKKLLVEKQVRHLYAYNASFDQRHLPELAEYDWRDIMYIAKRPKYNPYIPKDAVLTKTGGLKSGYRAEDVMRMIAGKPYFETHNAILDALDELKIMQKLGVCEAEYSVALTTSVPQKERHDAENKHPRPISPLRVSPEDRGVYDVTQVAQILRRDATYVAYMTMKGYLSCINVGGQPKYFKLSVKRFLENPPEDPEDLAEFREVYERMYMTRRPIVAEERETGKVTDPVAQVPKSPTAPTVQTVASPPPAQAVEKPVPVMRVAEIPKTPEQKETKKTWDVTQISAELKLAKTRIYDDIHTGKLKAEMDGRKYIITEEDYLRYKSYLEEQEQKRKMALEQAGCLATLLSAMLVTLSVVLLLVLL